jgi:cob(I)alamin adenosyltransferase
MKIYTKTGDSGTSSLYNGTRHPKNSPFFKLLGDIDELNCNLGMVKAIHKEMINNSEIKLYSAPGAGPCYKHAIGLDSGKYYEWFALSEYIHSFQVNLMDISAFIATPPYDSNHKVYGSMEEHLEKWVTKVGFNSSNYELLEKYIDRLSEILPKITNFVVPSGNSLIAQIHICRAITRRCERRFVDLYYSNCEYTKVYELIDKQISNIGIYLNRLSDYLFMLSRFVGMTLLVEEDLYKKIT